MPMKIGADEFCLYCIEWQEFDEEGRCKVCGKRIVKQKIMEKKGSYSRYETGLVDIEEFK